MSKKFPSDERCLRNDKVRKSNVSDVTTNSDKSLTKNVDPCLELEMDEAVKEIISSPEKYQSALLDVTVLKQKNNDSLYTIETTTLNGSEVRNLIASMDIEKQHNKELIDRILKNKASRSVDADLPTSMEESEAPKDRTALTCGLRKRSKKSIHSFINDRTKRCHHKYKTEEDGDHSHVEQVYTTPRACSDVRSLFACKNRLKVSENDKDAEPCPCKNCAIFGVIEDSQKRPYLESNDCHSHTSRSKQSSKKKNVTWKCNQNRTDEDTHVECQYYFKYLSTKILDLEARLAKQEEKTVAKDYFKKIITKLVNHISKLTTHSHDYKNIDVSSRYADKVSRTDRNLGLYHNKYNVNPLLLNDLKPMTLPSKKDVMSLKAVPDGNVNVERNVSAFWKWGEEILKPGVDLKNKIQSLLEESFNNFKTDLKLKEEASVDCARNEITARNSRNPKESVKDNKKLEVDEELPLPPRKLPSEIRFKSSNSDSTIFYKQRSYARRKKCHNCRGPRAQPPDNKPKPQVRNGESELSFKIELSDMDANRYNVQHRAGDYNEAYKMEFLNTLSNTKDADKLKLWQSIWRQAIANGQSKHDKVTIQIPRFKDANNHTIEIHYTIAELERLLTKAQHSRRSSRLERLQRMMERKHNSRK